MANTSLIQIRALQLMRKAMCGIDAKPDRLSVANDASGILSI
jgi:hypothetical protein